MNGAVDIENVHPAGNVFAEPCIYRVPERLWCLNNKAHTPQAVSIGPFHHGKEDLIVTEENKEKYLQNLVLFRSKAIVWGQEARLRNCYADTIDEQFSDDFVAIIVKDARFIIDVLLSYNVTWGCLKINCHFLILEKLFDPESITGLCPSDREGLSVMKLSYNFFKPLMHKDEGTEGNLEDIICSSKPQHFVDLLRCFYVRDHYMKAKAKGKMRTVPSVRELQQGEVKFEVLDSSNNLLDIKFHADTKTLKIPKVIK
ncbi:UPF0481 protein At3g47200-like [Rosa chinensis]|uniref:UPF0481 protein At3g47200-like n=1 Tax=Rosa chinensis TaxID=74649 RepID=UPI000D08666A|nr:UPF0481 protein At3g47200-like [Rosa chinensis]